MSLSFIFTLKVLNSEIKIFHINTLLFQTGGKGKKISLLSIDKNKEKFFFSVFNKKKELLPTCIINKKDLLNLKKRFRGFSILKDFRGFNFFDNFQKLKKNFSLMKKESEFQKLNYY